VEEEVVEERGEEKNEGGSGEEEKAEGDPRAGEGCSWWQYQPSSSPFPPTPTVPVSASQPRLVNHQS
jgi:hypothetical protein